MEEKQYIPDEHVEALKIDLLIKNLVETQATQLMVARLICQIEETTMENVEDKINKIRNDLHKDLLAHLKAKFILTANVEDILKNIPPEEKSEQ